MPVSKYVHTYTYIEKETYIHLCRKYAFPFHAGEQVLRLLFPGFDLFLFIFLFFWLRPGLMTLQSQYPSALTIFMFFYFYFFWQRPGIMTLHIQYTEFFYFLIVFFYFFLATTWPVKSQLFASAPAANEPARHCDNLASNGL
jgi:hypothetical protein